MSFSLGCAPTSPCRARLDQKPSSGRPLARAPASWSAVLMSPASLTSSADTSTAAGSHQPPPPLPSRCRPPPLSCDTFVALPDSTPDGSVVFGKNSDREQEEVQEVVAFAGGEHPAGATVRCTYIAIPQAPRTHAVVLSKPSWMWGAEMGANDQGVVVGNEAVWTREDSDGPPALLGMDLVRLALERGASAAAAVDAITSLLEAHGQGGACEEGGSWTYHNSFLVADASEAWVVETAGRCWVARRISQGVFNISNCLSVRCDFDRCSEGLQDYARKRGLWDGSAPFDWAASFSDGGAPPLGKLTAGREAEGRKLLERAAAPGGVSVQGMMGILRNRPSGICMCDGAFRSNGSQVSRLAGGGAQHWLTGTPDPQRSVFKPFRLGPPEATLDGSPHTAAAPARRNPPHALWQAWQAAYEGRHGGGGGKRPAQAALRELEARGLEAGGGLTWAAAVEEEMQLLSQA